MKLIVKTTSCNIWWGIYGLTGKSGWEDLHISNQDREKICTVCLNAKAYLREGMEELDAEEGDLIRAVKDYLADNKIHYRYFYQERDDPDFYEVPFAAPVNEKGVKPSSLEIWHPHERIGVSTIKTAIQAFAMKFLAIEDCEVTFEHIMPLEEAISSLEETYKLAGHTVPKRRNLSKKSLGEIAELWQMSEKEVLLKFKHQQKQK